MKTRKKAVIAVFSVIICVAAIIVLQDSRSKHDAETSGLENNYLVKTYTVKEAVDVMSQYIIDKGLLDEPLLVLLTSTDSRAACNTIDSGKDGKRADWNGEFSDINGSKTVVCTLRGAEINIEFTDESKNIPDNETGEKHLPIGQYKVSDIKLDSNDQVVLNKIKELGIRPGNPDTPNDWIKGYHYTLYGSDGKTLILAITGISPESPNKKGESMLARCEFNAEDGNYIGAIRKTGYDKDGRSIWVPM